MKKVTAFLLMLTALCAVVFIVPVAAAANWPAECPLCGGGPCQMAGSDNMVVTGYVEDREKGYCHEMVDGEVVVVFLEPPLPTGGDDDGAEATEGGGAIVQPNPTDDRGNLPVISEAGSPGVASGPSSSWAPAAGGESSGGQPVAGDGNDVALKGATAWLEDKADKAMLLWQGEIGGMSTKLWAALAGAVLLIIIIAGMVIKRVRRKWR